MKRYSVAEARKQIASILDAAEQGDEVIIERRGVRFSVRAVRRPARVRKRAPMVEFLDPAVEAGDWSWELGPRGLELVSPLARKPRRAKA